MPGKKTNSSSYSSSREAPKGSYTLNVEDYDAKDEATRKSNNKKAPTLSKSKSSVPFESKPPKKSDGKRGDLVRSSTS
ncbi:uncharacterized protein Bfra_006787 [Botrytis fragariae]|uniref:Uncharacterized protein n=1 Tax=Botrytis fragariae TaxID=1964551 RepID=A0A8H6B5F2_9HELO|nr:uncharacterized protein Bfra_006787 [Botrytis fragariae]KAF5879580.1 hypothetical protein Bfra_006787 [Botrytis fragariae]